MTLTLHWRSEADTAACAARLAARMRQQPDLQNAFIALQGGLGAGKTTFTRHLLRALGVQGRIKSPTYAVVEPHEGTEGLAISHFDFYRFSDPAEWEDAGLRDLFAAPGLKLAEWPEMAAALLPAADLHIHICPLAAGEAGGDTAAQAPARQALCTAATAIGQQLLLALEEFT